MHLHPQNQEGKQGSEAKSIYLPIVRENNEHIELNLSNFIQIIGKK